MKTSIIKDINNNIDVYKLFVANLCVNQRNRGTWNLTSSKLDFRKTFCNHPVKRKASEIYLAEVMLPMYN